MSRKRSSKKASGIISFALALLAALTIRWGVAEAYVIPSGSMMPTLLVHDHILVNKMAFGLRLPFSETWIGPQQLPERGDIVIFKDPRDSSITLIKRIVGLPGDQIAYLDGQLFVNGHPVHSERMGRRTFTETLGSRSYTVLHGQAEPETPSVVVPQGSFFALGDHRDNSADSRYWGFAPLKNIKGKAMFVWMSCDEGLAGSSFGCNPTTFRWDRFFHKLN